MHVVLCPYRDIGLLSPGWIIPHEVLHYQFLLNKLLLSSFNSSMPKKPLNWSILMAARICATNYPHSCTILSIVTSKNVIADKAHIADIKEYFIASFVFFLFDHMWLAVNTFHSSVYSTHL